MYIVIHHGGAVSHYLVPGFNLQSNPCTRNTHASFKTLEIESAARWDIVTWVRVVDDGKIESLLFC
jgi:hypothetical protein